MASKVELIKSLLQKKFRQVQDPECDYTINNFIADKISLRERFQEKTPRELFEARVAHEISKIDPNDPYHDVKARNIRAEAADKKCPPHLIRADML